MMTVLNLSKNFHKYFYIVATPVDGDLWFYGAYNDFSKAYAAVTEFPHLNRVVIPTSEVENPFVPEMPLFEGTMEALERLTIRK